MKKILLVSGCSMTDKNFISAINPDIDTSFPKWPDLIAKKLGMDCINLGRCGAGNEYIYASLLEKILEKKDQIGLVIPAWSQCHRQDDQEWGKWRSREVYQDGDVFGWLKKSLRYFMSLQIVCEKYNIPYKQIQMIPLYESWLSGLWVKDGDIFKNKDNPNYKWRYTYPGDKERDGKKLQKILLDFEPYINVKNFIGWPTIRKLGGYNVEHIVMKLRTNKRITPQNIADEFKEDLILSKWDQHPNGKGHEKLAEFIYDRLG